MINKGEIKKGEDMKMKGEIAMCTKKSGLGFYAVIREVACVVRMLLMRREEGGDKILHRRYAP